MRKIEWLNINGKNAIGVYQAERKGKKVWVYVHHGNMFNLSPKIASQMIQEREIASRTKKIAMKRAMRWLKKARNDNRKWVNEHKKEFDNWYKQCGVYHWNDWRKRQ